MAGVPHHAAQSYISRLIAKGYKVAICEQLTSAEDTKGIIERGVVRIVTPRNYSRYKYVRRKKKQLYYEYI